MGLDQEVDRHSNGIEYYSHPSACTRPTELRGRCPFQAVGGETSLEQGNEDDSLEMGPPSRGPIWADGREDISPRSLFLGLEEICSETSDLEGPGNLEPGKVVQGKECPDGSSSDMGVPGSNYSAQVGRGGLVAVPDGATDGQDKSGKAPRQYSFPVESKEWALEHVERVAGPNAKPLWSAATRKIYMGYAERFLRWVHMMGKTEEPLKDSVIPYLQWLALRTSGNSILRTGRGCC